MLRLIPETGNTGDGGGAYLLLDACPGCNADRQSHEVPMMSIAGLADLGLYQRHLQRTNAEETIAGVRPEVPIKFFDDPGHAPECPLR